MLEVAMGVIVNGLKIASLLKTYTSGRQPPGRGPVPVREEFVAGPYHFPG